MKTKTLFQLCLRLWLALVDATGQLLFEAQSCQLCQVTLRRSREEDEKEEEEEEEQAAQERSRLLTLCASGHTRAVSRQQQLAKTLTRNTNNTLCRECRAFFCSLTAVKTSLIGDDSQPPLTCFSSGFYHGPLQEAVYQIKYLKKPELAIALAPALIPPTVALMESINLSKTNLQQLKVDFVVPVPLHKIKMKERSFNQAEALAVHIADWLGSKVDRQNLKRVRTTRPQFGLSRSERRRNVAGAFKADKKLCGKSVILVDDVLTSGSTLYECAQAVRMAGGEVLGAVTLARAKWQSAVQLEETAVPTIALLL